MMKSYEQCRVDEVYCCLKQSVVESLQLYVSDRIETGGFLRAVLENNLSEAIGRADMGNRITLWNICCYVYNEMPSICWGSPEKVSNWLRERESVEDV